MKVRRLQSLFRQRYWDRTLIVALLENPEAPIEIGIQAEQLRYGNAIARQYLLKYNLSERQTVIKPGYFW